MFTRLGWQADQAWTLVTKEVKSPNSRWCTLGPQRVGGDQLNQMCRY